MRIGLLIVIAGLLTSAATAAPSPTIYNVVPRDYALTFQDEFDGSSLNLNKWQHEFTGQRRDAQYVDHASQLDGAGNLVIKTWTQQAGPARTHYTGAVSTRDRFEQTIGFWEARINWNDSPGMWSAFWIHTFLMRDVITPDLVDRPDLIGTEIDVAEHRVQNSSGTNIDSRIDLNVHWNGYGEFHKSRGFAVNGTDAGNGFHVYGLKWTLDSYTFYVDGLPKWTFTDAISRVPQFVILSSEVEKGWSGAP
ncbi:MAG TPA: glycoside hydrolase family 16 protein, partial [Tepidisphaeraceae bacterium]|nr:glycoside hydrolase family 16 protein [Tepidisphaeraceae bacterium]